MQQARRSIKVSAAERAHMTSVQLHSSCAELAAARGLLAGASCAQPSGTWHRRCLHRGGQRPSGTR